MLWWEETLETWATAAQQTILVSNTRSGDLHWKQRKNWKEDIFLSAMYKKPTRTRIVYKQKSIAWHNFQKFQTKIYYTIEPGTAQNVMLTKHYIWTFYHSLFIICILC